MKPPVSPNARRDARRGAWPLGALLILAAPMSAAALDVAVRDASGAPVAHAVVALDPIDGAAPAAKPGEAVMDQRQKQFAPHVLAIRRGTPVVFPNSDQIRHHVYSFSKPKRFELRLYSGVPAKPLVFDEAGTVVLGCNIHDRMVAYIRVLETPYFAVTDASGNVQVEDAAPGNYRLSVWHPQSGPESQGEQRTIALGKDTPVQNVTLPFQAETPAPAATDGALRALP